jgi:hypothetical protein
VIQAGGNTLHPETRKTINFIWNKEQLPQLWKESITVPIYKKDDKTVVIIEGHHCYQPHTQSYGGSSV